MFAQFFNGKKSEEGGHGFGYKGEINGVDMIVIRPQNRNHWLQIYDSGDKIEIKRIENHQVADAGDVPDCKKGESI